MDQEIMQFAEELKEFMPKIEHFIQKVHSSGGNFGQRDGGSGYYGQRSGGNSGGYYGQRMGGGGYGQRAPWSGGQEGYPQYPPQGEMPPRQQEGMYIDPRWLINV